MRITSRPALIAAAAAFPLSLAYAARADIAFNNLGPGDTYDVGSGYAVGGGLEYAHAFRFTAGTSGRITRLVVPIRHDSGTNTFTFAIHADQDGIPGALVGVIGQAAGFDVDGGPYPPVQINAAGSIALTATSLYWLVATGVGDADGDWFHNNQGQSSLRAYRRNTTLGWILGSPEMGAFRIEVAAGGSGCRADLDGNGQVQPADISLFINTWIASLVSELTSGDFDQNGAVQPADVSLFVSTWLTALTTGC